MVKKGAAAPKFELKGEPSEPHQVAVRDIKFHILLKLLLSNYFSTPSDNRFVNSHRFMLLAEKKLGNKSISCLELKLNAATHKPDAFVFRDFATLLQVTPTQFLPKNTMGETFWGRIYKDGNYNFRELKTEEVLSGKYEVLRKKTFAGTRTTLEFHSIKSLDAFQRTRGSLIQEFLNSFIRYLYGLGISMAIENVDLISFETKIPQSLISFPAEIQLVDNRIDKSASIRPIANSLNSVFNYAEEANKNTIPEIKWGIDFKPETKNPSTPWLVLQDYCKEDFEEEGKHFGKADPKWALYREFPMKAMQSITIPEKLDENELASFFTSDMNRLMVCIQQLTLKSISKGYINTSTLPYIERFQDWIFVSESAAVKVSYDGLSFWNLEEKDELAALFTVVQEQLEIDFEEILQRFFPQQSSAADFPSKVLKTTRFILRKGAVAKIESGKRRILYDYKKIVERLKKKENRFELDQFLLKDDFFNSTALRSDSCTPEEGLFEFNKLIQEIASKKNGKLSLMDLQSMDIKTRIKSSLGISNFRPLFRYYGMESEKAKNLMPTYSGISFNSNSYIVGEKDGMKTSQHNGHVIRDFQVLHGEFPIEEILPLLCVDFIRYRRFTAYPYPFYFIKVVKDQMEASKVEVGVECTLVNS